ncbi:MAG: protein translocase subunit SecF [Deltaproteobacteria bacterium]|nr:protein translocase subunit SecF [Deltaproteobacteria bacterium]
MELIKPDININFVGRRNLAFIFSGLLILMSLVSLILHGGPNYGVDFAGGVLVQVRFTKATNAAEIKKTLAPLGMRDATIQRFGAEDKDEFLIRTQGSGEDLTTLAEDVGKALKATYGENAVDVRRVETVGAKVGKDLREKALLAIYYAILLITVYISGRFEGKWALAGIVAASLVGATLLVDTLMAAAWGEGNLAIVVLIVTSLAVVVIACWLLKLRYALGAIVALIHDVLITVGVFSLLNLEFTLAIVAAILTIIGYSLNDTIIVFDRIRENIKKGGKRPLGEVINESVNQTLSRTILTSGTTLLVLFCLFILGGGVIQDFSLALLVGVGVGTYSSIFVASPVLLLLPDTSPSLRLKRSRKVTMKPSRQPRPAPAPATAPEPQAAAGGAKPKKKKSKRR